MGTPNIEEVQGKAAMLFRTTHMKLSEIGEAVGAPESQIRKWVKDGRWKKDFSQITANKVRRAVATGTSAQLSDQEAEEASEKRAAEIADGMERAFYNASDMIDRVGDLIGEADTGGKLKALVEANHKAVGTLRDIADLNRDDNNEQAVDQMVASLLGEAEAAISTSEQNFEQSGANQELRH